MLSYLLKNLITYIDTPIGIVNHIGRSFVNGHYVSFARHDVWSLFNDSQVRQNVDPSFSEHGDISLIVTRNP